jgi:hypothetical protein
VHGTAEKRPEGTGGVVAENQAQEEGDGEAVEFDAEGCLSKVRGKYPLADISQIVTQYLLMFQADVPPL